MRAGGHFSYFIKCIILTVKLLYYQICFARYESNIDNENSNDAEIVENAPDFNTFPINMQLHGISAGSQDVHIISSYCMPLLYMYTCH